MVHSQLRARVDWPCVSVCTVHICTCVFACEIECRLVVSCRPQCRLMPYRQVIYDLSLAGRETGDTRLSLLINKPSYGAHITSPRHVCEGTDLALALLFWSSQATLSSLLLDFSSCFCQFLTHILNRSHPLLIPCSIPAFPTLFASHLCLSFFYPFFSAGSWGPWHVTHHLQEYGVKSISWRTLLQR